MSKPTKPLPPRGYYYQPPWGAHETAGDITWWTGTRKQNKYLSPTHHGSGWHDYHWPSAMSSLKEPGRVGPLTWEALQAQVSPGMLVILLEVGRAPGDQP